MTITRTKLVGRLPLFCIPLLSLLLLSGCDENQFTDVIADNWIKEEAVCAIDNTPVVFKKVAYWTPDGNDNLENINFSALTHINYASLEVDKNAQIIALVEPEKLEDMVIFAHAKKVKVLISIGSWDNSDSALALIAKDKSLSEILVDNIIDFIDEYELDGVDINWKTVSSKSQADDMESLLKRLSEKLRKEGKLLTMTAPSGEDEKSANLFPDTVFQYVDFVNVLAFDSTNKDNLHSSMQDAQDAVNYWSERCLIKNKLVLGIPFYSRGAAVQSYAYLINDDISYACVDESERRDYNGIPTVIEKTNYAKLNAGGIMIKSLEQDSYDQYLPEYSLLQVINQTVSGIEVLICQ